jgi:predicted Zn-dependent protease
MKRIPFTVICIFAIIAWGCGPASAARTHEEILQQAQVETERVCSAMIPFLERPGNVSSVGVIDEDVINAYADDGGNVRVYMGMIDFFQSEDELAAVCGHEMAHLSAEHISDSTGTSILAGVVGAVVGGTVGDIAGSLLYTKQSRKHERDADSRGLFYAWNAGFNPYVTVDLWEGMSRLSGDMALEKYLSTHPVSQERVENFKVLLYRFCLNKDAHAYCDEILADPYLKSMYDQFESR